MPYHCGTWIRAWGENRDRRPAGDLSIIGRGLRFLMQSRITGGVSVFPNLHERSFSRRNLYTKRRYLSNDVCCRYASRRWSGYQAERVGQQKGKTGRSFCGDVTGSLTSRSAISPTPHHRVAILTQYKPLSLMDHIGMAPPGMLQEGAGE